MRKTRFDRAPACGTATDEDCGSGKGDQPSSGESVEAPAVLRNEAVVRAHILRNQQLPGWRDAIEGRWTYRQLRSAPEWFSGWISFDCVTFDPRDGAIYCGLNSLDGDLLYRFDASSETFESLDTRQWTDQYDVKIDLP